MLLRIGADRHQMCHQAYQPIFWESTAHIARAAERRRRRECIVAASPSVEHVRHLLDVLLGRATLDNGVARVATVFFNQALTTILPQELRKLLVACAFHAKEMTVLEASRFCFFALRYEMEQAISREDVVFMLEHSLIGRTVEMPEAELRRRVMDIFGDTMCITLDDFVRYFICNYAMWCLFGLPITVGEEKSARADDASATASSFLKQSDRSFASRASSAADKVSTALVTAEPDDNSVWRTFVVRVQHSNKAFSVTAHVNDTILDVMVMVQNSTGIRASCQEWRTSSGVLLNPACILGSTELGFAKADATTPDVTIISREESVRLVMLYKEKGIRWELRMPISEKVLKLRALVQQKTLIPLTRCALRARGFCLLDRHPLRHYQLQDGDVVAITQE